jgi:hypothetical protein
MIYAVEILDSRFVKIGFSKEETAAERICSLQTGSPFQIAELFCVEGTLRQEQSLHASLRDAFTRIRVPVPPNEWYPGKNPFFQEFLSKLRVGFDFGHTFLATYHSNVRQPGHKANGNTLTLNAKWPKPRDLL